MSSSITPTHAVLDLAALSEHPLSIRVSPNSYFAALFLVTFFAAFLVYLEFDLAAGVLFGLAWLAIPLLIFTDRITFDGKRVGRSGMLWHIWSFLNNSRRRLKLSDIEQVETQALRAMKRGGNIFYRYRTTFRGKGIQFAFASGGEDYRQMVGHIFPLLSENMLDNRSIELRDYLSEPKEVLARASDEHIPSADVLANSKQQFAVKDKTAQRLTRNEITPEETEKAGRLRRLANELRHSGFLLQALEAFRRAVRHDPFNGWLLFEFARCLQSFAGAEHDPRLERKAKALMRLAERRAGTDEVLLTRLGESYFQFGDWKRARVSFQKAIDLVGETFRSVRGLAEIALREGKIAHVIHHFSAANRLAETPALRRWTQGEADYFLHLNNDEEYMETEVSRVNLLESLERAKKSVLRIAILGFPAILLGLFLEDSLVANIGWAVSFLSLLLWLGMLLLSRVLNGRIPYHLIDES